MNNQIFLQRISDKVYGENGSLSYLDYVWKHKEGVAGFSLILSPTETIVTNREKLYL